MRTVPLNDSRAFQLLTGLWTGKKPPFIEACVLRNTNFGDDGRLHPTNVARLTVEQRHLERSKLRHGDIILERSGGGPKQPVGRVAFFDFESDLNFAFSNFTSAIRVLNPAQFESLFVHYFLLHFYNEGGTRSMQSNTTGIRNLNFDSYKQIKIPELPLAEQRGVAALLAQVQEAVDIENELVRVTRELKQAALRQLFTRGLRGEPQKETEIGPVPESWDVLPLSVVASFASGGTPSKSDALNWGGEIPWVSPKDMKQPRIHDTIDHITRLGLDSGSRMVPPGSILVVIRGMILMRVVPVALTMVPVAFNQDMKAILPGEKVNAEFLLYAFEAFRPQLFSRVGTSAHGTRTLSSSALENFLVPLPSLAEQREIAALLGTIDAKLAHHEARQKLLRELFRTLLHDLMTARRRVKEFSAPTLEGSVC